MGVSDYEIGLATREDVTGILWQLEIRFLAGRHQGWDEAKQARGELFYASALGQVRTMLNCPAGAPDGS